MSRENALALALDALGWIVASDELRPVFMAATGLDAADLGAGVHDPAFLEGVLDFLVQQDRWVLDFSAASGHPPDVIAQARVQLAGPAFTNWT